MCRLKGLFESVFEFDRSKIYVFFSTINQMLYFLMHASSIQILSALNVFGKAYCLSLEINAFLHFVYAYIIF